MTGVVEEAGSSGTSYIVTVGGYSGIRGTIRLNLVDNDSILDSGSRLKLGGVGAGRDGKR